VKVFFGSDAESSATVKMVDGSPGKSDYSAVVGAEHLDSVDNNDLSVMDDGIAPHNVTKS
jgi:hypothetical protein